MGEKTNRKGNLILKMGNYLSKDLVLQGGGYSVLEYPGQQ